MGLFEKIFNKKTESKNNDTNGYFETFSAYTPIFTKGNEKIYEQELIRTAIDARARHISKLDVRVEGSAKPKFKTKMKISPNPFQTWSQFMYRLSTILDVQNTAFIVPILDEYDEITGLYPILPSLCEVIEYDGSAYLKYTFVSGKTAVIELEKCGIMTKFQYADDFKGEDNKALLNTLDLISIQNQGVKEAVKNSATYRFMARLNNFSKKEDLAKERGKFSKENMQGEGGGILLFPNTYTDVKQIDSKPYIVDAQTRKLIQENVFNYFGVNEDVLQNKTVGDKWAGFYEGAIEPFAIQFSEVVSKMVYSENERIRGSFVMASANRLQYMTNQDKLNVSSQMTDRGIMNRDEIRQIWNLPKLPNGEGEKYIIRGEYYFTGEKEGEENEKEHN